MVEVERQLGIELISLLETELRVFLLDFQDGGCGLGVREEHRAQWKLRIEGTAGMVDEVAALRFVLPSLALLPKREQLVKPGTGWVSLD